jgi:arylsulfatase A-like enzyme
MIFIGFSALCLPVLSQAEEDKPNILVIWGDYIGVHNISAYKGTIFQFVECSGNGKKTNRLGVA